MKQQEVWRFRYIEGRCLLSINEPSRWLSDVLAAAYDNGFWQLWDWLPILGVRVVRASGHALTMDEAKLAVASEIRRQLATHGKRAEIRMVSK